MEVKSNQMNHRVSLEMYALKWLTFSIETYKTLLNTQKSFESEIQKI